MTACLLTGASGCFEDKPEVKPPTFETLPPKVLPAFLRGTINERMDHTNPDPAHVSDFGLVVNLPGTGDGTAPAYVREYIINNMRKRGFGSVNGGEVEHISPTQLLDSKRAAIVRVDGYMPPGVRKGQTFDLVVSALPDSGVTSLAGGDLYRVEMKFGGADTRNLQAMPNIAARGEGTVFINPALSLNPKSDPGGKNASSLGRRIGVVMGGGEALVDQPLILRLRAPQRSVMRQIQARINQQYQSNGVADPKNEAIMHLMVPDSYRGDWERFIGVVMNLYLDGRTEILAGKAQELAREALRPDAPLLNISFAWEGMGDVALPAIIPLMNGKYPDDVRFVAARAAAYIGDLDAPRVLASIAVTPGSRFQTDAARALGGLRPTLGTDRLLRKLLDAESALVRVEAYKSLAANRSNTLNKVIMPRGGANEKFVLDLADTGHEPLVYATRSGLPRLAILGRAVSVAMPMTLTGLDDRLTIIARPGEEELTIFYRPADGSRAVKLRSPADLSVLVGWLGGYYASKEGKLELDYGDIVAVVQAMADRRLLYSAGAGGGAVAVNFILEDSAGSAAEINDAPPIVPRPRPTSDLPPGIPTTRQVGGGAVKETSVAP